MAADNRQRVFDAIIRAEGTGKYRNPYDEVLGYGAYGQPDKPLSSLSIAEAIAAGETIRRAPNNPHNSSAIGAFQITATNLRRAISEWGFDPNQTFDSKTQQAIAARIADEQGLKAWEGFKYNKAAKAEASAAFSALGKKLTGGRAGITAPPALGSRVLSRGMHGPDVTQLQSVLERNGLLKDYIPGVYNKKTATAVKQLQTGMNDGLKTFGLKPLGVDGKWGGQSMMAAKALNVINPRTPFGSVKQSGPVAAAAARYRALNQPDLPSFSEALAARNALTGPQAAAAARLKAQAAQPTYSAPKRVLTAPVSPGGTPVMRNVSIDMAARTRMPVAARLAAGGLTPEVMQRSVSAQQIRAQQLNVRTPSVGGVPTREPTQSELDFFRARPQVGGYAAPDNKVVLNPYSKLSPAQRASVALNEAARVQMRVAGKQSPPVTEEQQSRLTGYGAPDDIRNTVVARIIANDPTAGRMTMDQYAHAKEVAAAMNYAMGDRSQQPAIPVPRPNPSAPATPQGTVIGNPAGINMADRRRFTPNQMLSAVEDAAVRRELAARAATPVPRPNPTPARTTPSASDLARNAGAAKVAAANLARQAAPVPRPNPSRPAPVPRPNPTPSAASRVVASGASPGGYRPSAASSVGRVNASTTAPTRTVSAPKVTAVSPAARSTTDVPASMRSGYPTKPSGSQLGGYNPAAVASVGRVSVRAPAPVAVSKPPPAPKPAFTAPQVAAASSQPAAGPLAGAAARYGGTLAAQAAKVAAPAPVAPPVPRMSPVPPAAPAPVAVAAPVAPPPQPKFINIPLPARLAMGAVVPGVGLGIAALNKAMLGFPNAGAKMGVSNVERSGTTPQGLNWSRGTNRYGQKTMSYTDSRGVTHNTTTIGGRDYYSRGAASSGGGSGGSSGSSRSSGSTGKSTSSGSSGNNPSGVRGGRGKKPGKDR